MTLFLSGYLHIWIDQWLIWPSSSKDDISHKFPSKNALSFKSWLPDYLWVALKNFSITKYLICKNLDKWIFKVNLICFIKISAFAFCYKLKKFRKIYKKTAQWLKCCHLLTVINGNSAATYFPRIFGQKYLGTCTVPKYMQWSKVKALI